MFVILLVEFLIVIGVLGVVVACTSCGGVGVELASSLQCLNLRGADVSTRSTSDPDDSLSHSEHCLQIALLTNFNLIIETLSLYYFIFLCAPAHLSCFLRHSC